jgi:hypothetical protein
LNYSRNEMRFRDGTIHSHPNGAPTEKLAGGRENTGMMKETITDRLAIGLARQAIRNWKGEVVRSQKRLEGLFLRDLSTGKAARRLARDVESALRPVAFSVSSVEVKKRGTYQHWVVPNILDTDHGEYLQVEVQSALIGLEGLDPLSNTVVLLIHAHALARLFLRLQSADRTDVQHEIGSTVLIGAAAAEACARLGLQQLVFPTQSGVFRCDLVRLDEEAVALAAKTWISSKTASARDEAVATSIVRTLVAWGQTVNPPELIPYLLMHAQVPEELVEGLCAALAPHEWLKEPYVERPDHLSQLWAAARKQAHAADGGL